MRHRNLGSRVTSSLRRTKTGFNGARKRRRDGMCKAAEVPPFDQLHSEKGPPNKCPALLLPLVWIIGVLVAHVRERLGQGRTEPGHQSSCPIETSHLTDECGLASRRNTFWLLTPKAGTFTLFTLERRLSRLWSRPSVPENLPKTYCVHCCALLHVTQKWLKQRGVCGLH